MRRRIILTVCFWASLFSATLVFSQETAKIHGRCVDEKGNSLQGAEVLLYYNSFPIQLGKSPKELGCGVKGRTVTGRNGEFELPAGLLTYQPRVFKQTERRGSGYCLLARYTDRAIGICILEKGKETQPQTLTLGPGWQLKVSAVKEGDKGKLSGVRVWLWLTGGAFCYFNEDTELASGVTDKNGECTISNLPLTNCYFFANKEGYVTAMKEIGGGAQGVNIKFVMSKGIIVGGRAVFLDGKPASGLIVKFFKEEYWSQMASYAVTDSEGRWPAVHLPVSYRNWFDPSNSNDDTGQPITVVADQFLEGSPFVSQAPVLLDTKEKQEFDVELKVDRVESGKLFVKFVTPDQQPLPGNKASVYTSGGPQLQGGPDEIIGVLAADAKGVASLEVSLKKVTLLQEQKVTIPNWYIPETHSGLSFIYGEGRWQVDSQRGVSPPEALYRFAGGSGTEKDPLIIKVGVIPAKAIDGFVFDAEGKPAGNCSVYSGFAQQGVKTDGEGKFTFSALPKDKKLELFAISSDKKFAGMTIVAPELTEPVKITVLPTKDYPGKVVDCDGMPVGKMFFRADLRLDGKEIFPVREEVTTDNESKFILHNAYPASTYYFWWSGDDGTNRDFDYGNAEVKLSGITEKNPLTITAKRYIECIMGKVVDNDGKPVKGAKVEVLNWDLSPQDVRFAYKPIITNEEGGFTVGRLAKGKTNIQINHPDYKGVLLADVRTDSIDVVGVLQPKGPLKVTVRVKDSKSKPVTGAELLLFGVDSNRYVPGLALRSDAEILKREGKTDRKGICIINDLEQSDKKKIQWSLLCDLPGYYSFFCGLPGDMDTEVEIILKKQGEIDNLSGQVVDMNGKSIKGVSVKAVSLSSGSYNKGIRSGSYYPEEIVATSTDQEGKFTFPKISRDCWGTFEAQADGYAQNSFYPRTGREIEKEIVVRLFPPCEISGQILYDDTKKPAEGILVSAYSMAGGPGSVVYRTDREGMYRLKNLPAGTYLISASFRPLQPVQAKEEPPDWVIDPAGYDSINAEPNKPVIGKDFLLKKGMLVSGKVVEEKTGKPLVGAFINCYAKELSPAGIYCGAAQTDSEGRYKIRALSGKIYLQFYKPGDNTPQSKEVILEEGKLYNEVDFTVK